MRASWHLDKNKYVDYRVDTVGTHIYKVYKYIINTRLPIRIGNDTENTERNVNNGADRGSRDIWDAARYLGAVLAILPVNNERTHRKRPTRGNNTAERR